MKRIFIVLLLSSIGMVACHQAAGDWQVDADTFGPIRIGMTVQDAEKVTATAILQEPLSNTANATCRYAEFEGKPKQVRLMTAYDQIVRIDIQNPQYKTIAGAHVGMPVEQVLSLYPNRLKVEPDKYTGHKGGRNLIVIPQADKFHRLIFETDGKKVTNIRLGKEPEVEYVEGCS